MDLRVNLAMNVGKARGFFKKGDVVIVLTGWCPGSGFTNTMLIVPVPWSIGSLWKPSSSPCPISSPIPSIRPATLVVLTLGQSVTASETWARAQLSIIWP